MYRRYHNCYTSETEGILSEVVNFFPCKLLVDEDREDFPPSVPMLLLRNCAKLFCMNELEACKVLYLMKEIGWTPSQLIKDNIQSFTPPRFLLDRFIETLMHIRPLFVQLMLICFTAKMLLNDRYVVNIIQMWIECKTFPDFGYLFNRWIKQNESSCSINLKKLNKIYTNSLQTPKNYRYSDLKGTLRTKTLEHQAVREALPQAEEIGAHPVGRLRQHEHSYAHSHRDWLGSVHDRDTSNRNTRKNSITSQDIHSQEPSEIGLERGQSFQTNFLFGYQRHGYPGPGGGGYHNMLG